MVYTVILSFSATKHKQKQRLNYQIAVAEIKKVAQNIQEAVHSDTVYQITFALTHYTNLPQLHRAIELHTFEGVYKPSPACLSDSLFNTRLFSAICTEEMATFPSWSFA